jgi:hypothetical protein
MNNRQPPRRKTKKEKIAESEFAREKQKKSLGWITAVICLSFFFGSVLMIFEIGIYRKTIIDWRVPTGIWLLAGFAAMPFTKSILVKTGAEFWGLRLVYNIEAIGGVLTFAFMWMNCHFADSQERKVTAAVVSTGQLAKGRYGCRNPYAKVKFGRESKQVIFPCDFVMGNQQLAELTLRRGLWGFDVIIKQELIDKPQ